MADDSTTAPETPTGQGTEQRYCYCPVGDQPAPFPALPPGFCGICEECGALGHTRHSPFPAPYTGAWCDPCYDELGRRAPLFYILTLLVLYGIPVAVIAAVVGFLLGLGWTSVLILLAGPGASVAAIFLRAQVMHGWLPPRGIRR